MSNTVQNFTKAKPVHRRYGHRVSKTKRIKFVDVHFLIFAVYFIDAYHYRFTCFAKKPGNGFIITGHSGPGIHHKKNDIGLFHGQFCLLTNAAGNLVIIITEFNSSCIDEGEFFIQPLHITINSISGYAWNILYNGHAPLGKTVNQCGFPYIRPADNGYERFTHNFHPFFI